MDIKPEIVDPTALQAMTAAEVDVQIATAKRFPRDIRKSIARAKELATSSVEMAEQCIFSLPRAGKNIEGPSVRFAEILAHSWGNLRYGARVMEEGKKEVVVEGRCHDLETNVMVQKEVRVRITDRNGNRYKDDMVQVTANAGCSRAFRNAVFSCLPRALWEEVFEAVDRVLDKSDVNSRRQRAFAWFKARDVTKEMILDFLGLDNPSQVDAKHLKTLNGIRNAIIEESTTPKEVFGESYKSTKNAGDLPDNGRQYDGPAFGEAASSTDDDPEDDVPAFTEGDRLLAELRDVVEMQDCVEGVEALCKELKHEQVNTLVEHGLLEVFDRLVDERKQALRGAGV